MVSLPLRRLLAVLCLLLPTLAAAEARDVRVFAAASLSDALRDVGDAFKAATGHRLVLVSAGSSTLARQIEAGARADIFLSADEDWMQYLQVRNLIQPATRRRLLTNTLVLVVPAGRAREVHIASGGAWLRDLGSGRVAVGDPAHVPVGKYARTALEALAVWHEIKPRLATALDTRAALALVERGEAVAGIVYASDATASRAVRVAAVFPAIGQLDISYPVALLAGARDPAALQAYRFLCGPRAEAVFARHGFAQP